MKLSSVQRDRAAGVLVAMAAADTLGAPYEFGPPLSNRPLMHADRGWELGEWTDDTSMALAIAKASFKGRLEPTEVATNFLSWIDSGPKDVGIQTHQVLRAAGGDPARVALAAAAYFEANPRNSAGTEA